MHHMYPLAKGDQLCPLGFHPQVRWPTRCKRCFRDYKEHGGKRGNDDIAASSPSLSDSTNLKTSGRTWTSTQNLSTLSDNNGNNDVELRKRPSSWTSTPDLDGVEQFISNDVDVSVNVKLPPQRRRHTTTLDTKELEESLTIKPPIAPSSSSTISSQTKSTNNQSNGPINQNHSNGEEIVFLKSDSLAERVRKMNLLKKQNSAERESSRERSRERSQEKSAPPLPPPRITEAERLRQANEEKKETVAKKEQIKVPEQKLIKKEVTPIKKTTIKKQNDVVKATQDVQFLIQIKENSSKNKKDDNISMTTETTNTTLVDPIDHNLQDEVKHLKKELELMKARAERAERDKSDILLRRLASLDTGPNRTAASEALKLQQKVNELKAQVEDLKDDKRSLSVKVKELEQDINSRPAKVVEDELKRKLQAAEQLCEELMDENEDIKKELKGMEQEIDEMHDSFREDQAEEFTSIRKELEQTTKNCRILSFKLKKSERRIEQLENEKQSFGAQNTNEMLAKIKKLEGDLKLANELSRRLQNEIEQTSKNDYSLATPKKKPPSLGVIGKSTSADAKYTRESLTRGGSQEDPVQLLRDLQDSLEREADLKEQLKFAEEENKRLRHRRRIPPKENRGIQTEEIPILCYPCETQTQIEVKDVETCTDDDIMRQFRDIECATDIILCVDSSTDCLIIENNNLKDNTTQFELINCSENETNTINIETNDICIQTDENSSLINNNSNSCQGATVDLNREDKTRQIKELTPPIGFTSLFGLPRIGGYFFPNLFSDSLVEAATGRKLSPIQNRHNPEPIVERDEGISDEDDPAELRVLLELNEQEAAILRQKVEELETENKENKKQIKELQGKLKTSTESKKLPSFLSRSNSLSSTDKKVKVLEDEMAELRKSIIEKDNTIEKLKAEIAASKKSKTLSRNNSQENNNNVDLKRQMEMVEQEAIILRGKVLNLEQENEKLSVENRKLQLQTLRKNSTVTSSTDKLNSATEITKLKESLSKVEKERDELSNKLKMLTDETNEKLSPRTPKKVTDLTPKANLKKWVEELEEEIKNLRAMVVLRGGDKIQKLENEKSLIEKELISVKEQLKSAKESLPSQTAKMAELEQKYKKSEDNNKKLSVQTKELEEKVKKQDQQIKSMDSLKVSFEMQLKREKEKISNLEKNLEKEKQERASWEKKVAELDEELTNIRSKAEKTKESLEKEIQDLKSKSNSNKTDTLSNKKLQELKKQNEDLQGNLNKEIKKYVELTGRYETLSEEYVHVKAELATEKQNLQGELNLVKQKQSEYDSLKTDYSEICVKLKESLKRITELESKNIKVNALQYEKNMLKSSLTEKEKEFEKLKQENTMNIDFVSQLRRENEQLRRQLDDFERVNKVHRSMNDRNNNLEDEVRILRSKIENTELNAKSEVASTRLRYEQQVKNLSTELTSMQRQCERFKKDRDTFKQLLESAQKTIGDLKTSGRQSRSSGTSGDEDDKGKIIQLEQQIGCLEDQLSESRLEVSKLKTELVSERSANEIKISEMTSKLNEYEEDRLIGSGRTKVAGVKTKLELSWQKEREDQQRLLQETSTLARDLRQTLFEVEREKDKERLEAKRKLEQLKKANEEELEEGRKKISELQCDLLELRDAHAKLRTANEKLRRERERHEKEQLRRRLEQDGEQKIGALLQTVDELIKIAPELKKSQPQSIRSRSPSPSANIQISSVLTRLGEASEDLRRYQRLCEDERERDKSRRSGMRRAASTENDNSSGGIIGGGARIVSSGRLNRSQNGSLYRKSLSLDQSIQQDQSIWRQDDGSLSSMQSIDSEMGGHMIRESSLDSRLSGGSTQSDIPRPRKKKRGLIGKLRSLTKSRGTESEGSMQGSDSDISASSDLKSSKMDLKGRLSGMFRRAGSTSRSNSTETGLNNSLQRPVAVTIVGGDDLPTSSLPPLTTPKLRRTPTMKPPTPTTPTLQRKIAK